MKTPTTAGRWLGDRDWYMKFHEEDTGGFSTIVPVIEQDEI
ncbi:hypothetical protein [Pontibacter pudoricolor]|nr:hypothetical protein [Pontibacter pudoricolor]